jgi:hypothetical protein
MTEDKREDTVQVNRETPKGFEGSVEGKVKAQKQLVEELNVQWKLLWNERFNDRVRAEGVSVGNYDILRVEKGTIIHATRDYKALNFKEILSQHLVENPERFIQPSANVGGWNKFVKTKIAETTIHQNKRALSYVSEKRAIQQPKKSGRGWLHIT